MVHGAMVNFDWVVLPFVVGHEESPTSVFTLILGAENRSDYISKMKHVVNICCGRIFAVLTLEVRTINFLSA